MESQMRARVVERDVASDRAYLQRVYGWMSGALAVTGVVAMLTASSPAAMQFIFANRGVFFGLLIGELLLVMVLAAAVQKMSAGVATAAFMVYAALNGLTLSAIFLLYTKGSIATTFFVTAGTFGAMAVFGAVTKRELNGLGHFCWMGLIGLIIASVVNIFMHSEMLYWLTTYAGVLIFTGLTAYDTQKIRQARLGATTQGAISGALMLYLDFINLFLYLLRLLGDRRR
jgi:FtsH-binding integral membrane protein